MKYFFFLLIGIWGTLAAAGELTFDNDAALWEFLDGREFPGAAGTLTTSADGAIRLAGDFRGGGRYVGARTVAFLPEFDAFSFEVRGAARGFSLRVTDSAGQTHQYFYEYSGRDGEWQKIEFRIGAPSKAHWGGANDGIFRGAPRSVALILGKRELETAEGGLEFRNLTLAGTSVAALARVVPDASRYFVAPDAAWFELEAAALDAAATAGPVYRLTDYAGNPVAEGVTQLDHANRRIRVPLPGRAGFYEIALPDSGVTVGVMASEVFRGENDEYFGIDFSSSRSHLSEPVIRGMMRALTRHGVFWCRDRFGWEHLNPARDVIDFNALGGRYEMLRRVAAEEGIRILDVTHDAPGWNKKLRSEKDNFLAGANTGTYSRGSNVFPRDLIAGAEAWSRILAHWPVTGAFEVWNEPDIRFGNNFPPEYVAALTRAVSRELSRDGVAVSVIGGCLAYPNPQLYGMLIRNGVLEASDALSFHTYKNVAAQEELVAALRRCETEITPEFVGFPLWVTESGMPWPAGPARPPVAADRASAREITGKAFEFRALGIRKYFPFLIKYYTEPQRNFGMFDRNMTPLRSIAAYFRLVAEIAGKRYVGDLELPDAVRARVFAGSDSAVVCVYAPDSVTLRLPRGVRPRAVRGADGRSLSFDGENAPLPDGIGYLEFAGEIPAGFLKKNIPALQLYERAAAWPKRERSGGDLVIQPDFDMTKLEYTNIGYYLQPGDVFEMRVILNHFGDRPLEFSPELQLPPGCREADAATGNIILPPRSRREYVRHFRVDDSLIADRFSIVRLLDRNGGGVPLTLAVRRRGYETMRIATEPGAWTRLPEAGWKGTRPCDVAAKFRASYTPDVLRLEIEVKDAVHFCDFPAGRLWNGDSIQCGLALPRRGDALDEAGELEFMEITAAQTPGGMRVEIGEPGSKRPMAHLIRSEFRREGEMSRYTLQIPREVLGVKRFHADFELRFSLLVNSNDGSGRCGYLTWGDGIGDGKYPALFNQLQFQ